MNDIQIGHGGSSFDRKGFWLEANPILFEGTREMLVSIKDKGQLVAAYDRMDWLLMELVQRWQPPEGIKAELHEKLDDRLNFIGRKMGTANIDPMTYWAKEEKRVSIAILNGAGFRSHQMRLDRLTESAAEVIAGGSNLTKDGAERLIREFASVECKSIRDIMAHIRDDPNHMELASFFIRKGTPRAKAEAQKALDRMMPVETRMPKRAGVVIEMRRPQPLMRPQ